MKPVSQGVGEQSDDPAVAHRTVQRLHCQYHLVAYVDQFLRTEIFFLNWRRNDGRVPPPVLDPVDLVDADFPQFPLELNLFIIILLENGIGIGQFDLG